MTQNNNSTTGNSFYIGFGDILYSIIIGLSFEHLRDEFLSFKLSFATFTIFLAYATIIQSWLGYHKTVGLHPYDNSFRFVIDLIIWFLFYILISLSNTDNFIFYIGVFPVIFFFLMLWRYGIIREKYIRNGIKKTIKALSITIIHIITSVAIVIIYYLFSLQLSDKIILDSITLTLMYIEVFTYYQLRKYDRISKVLTKKNQ